MTDGNGSGDSVVIERTFDAPVERVWQLWTDPEQFKEWYGPSGATITVADFDVRVGGTRKVCMEVESPAGAMVMWFVGKHLEVVEHQRLTYTEAMADEAGNTISPAQRGMPAEHPTMTEVRVQFAAEDGRTRMVMTHVGIPAGSPGEAGWSMAFDKLAAVIAAASAP